LRPEEREILFVTMCGVQSGGGEEEKAWIVVEIGISEGGSGSEEGREEFRCVRSV
jgi:hypothetical protein